MGNQVEYSWINVYIDNNNPDRLWAVIHYNEIRRTKKIPREKIASFKNYNEMMSFVRSNFDNYELDNYIPYSQKRIKFYYVDYLYVNRINVDSNPEANKLQVGIREHSNMGVRDYTIDLPVKYESMILDYLRANRNIPKNDRLYSDIYRVTNIHDVINKNINSKEPRQTRAQIKYERKRREVPMGEPKEKNHLIRNLVIFGSLIIILTSEGIKLIHQRMDTNDGIVLDKLADYGDYQLLLNKGHMGEVIEKLVQEDYRNVSKEDIDNIDEFLNKMELSNYDNNSSFNYVRLSEYRFDVGYSQTRKQILETLDKKYAKCFRKSNSKNNNYVLDKEAAKDYLDYALPLIVMNNSPYLASANSYTSRYLETYNPKYPEGKEVEEYLTLPGFIHEVNNLRVLGLLMHLDEYNFAYPHYVHYDGNGRDLDTMIALVAKISENEVNEMKREIQIAQNEDTIKTGKN